MKTFLKVPQSVRRHFELLECPYKELQAIVDPLIKDCIPNKWLYFSRIKSVESFYAKMSQGRLTALMEDIFAGTIVVERFDQINEAITYLSERFVIVERRPVNSHETSKYPESFQFDDLRLYLRLKEWPKNGELINYKFEIQIKTYLQHAWITATHDLIYKSDKIGSWARKRVAFQIKAMLEHIETSILKVDELAKADLINMSTRKIRERIKIGDKIKEWEYELGNSTSRIVESIQDLLELFSVTWDDVVIWIEQITNEEPNGGRNATRFSLYEIVLDAICKKSPESLKLYDKNLKRRNKDKILVADEWLDIHPECKDFFRSLGN